MSLTSPVDFFEESDHPLAELYRKRVRQNRDLVILITDSSNDRGTGKTTEALRLAHGMDRTEEGVTEEKVSIAPHELTKSYVNQPRGSGLVLDESEVGLDKYRAGSAINKSIRDLVSTGRIMEKYLVLNAPADHLVDTDLKSLVDVWILVERRGFAHVYRMDWNPHEGHPLTHKMGTVTWEPIPQSHDLYNIYEVLAEEKESHLLGEAEDSYIEREEAEKMVKKARKETRTEIRDELIRSMSEHGLTQSDIGSVVELSQARVSEILNQ